MIFKKGFDWIKSIHPDGFKAVKCEIFSHWGGIYPAMMAGGAKRSFS